MNRFDKSREIVERIIVEGELVLQTPTSLGSGDSEGLTDMPLLLDEHENKALLTGTSIAGALRTYLREISLSYETSEESQYKDAKGRKELKDENGNAIKDQNGNSINVPLPIVTQLFGSLVDEDGAQSSLIIDDAFGDKLQTELRDGVRIDGNTRTAVDKAKFDLELLEAGTKFLLRFELLITQDQLPHKSELISAFAAALQGFEKSEIHLGARKRRGYGECKVENWTLTSFDLTTKDGLIDWLKKDFSQAQTGKIAEIYQKLYGQDLNFADCREWFEMTACFALDGSMLIRSGSKISDKVQPDDVHLRSKRGGKLEPIVSGTALGGVLRHRAVKICNTLSGGKGERFVEKFFGADMEKLRTRNTNNQTKEQPFASRLEVRETVIENTNDLVQTRIKIDRFTGGAYEGALFDAAPVFAKNDKQALAINLKLRNPKNCEIGLLLLLLKDLWTADLPIGGESSIGRGRLKGLGANLIYKKSGGGWNIQLKGDANNGASVVIEEYFEQNGADKIDKKAQGYNFLNKFVDDLNTKNWETETNNGG